MFIGVRRTLLKKKSAAAAANTLALDGSAEGTGSGATVTATMSTSLANNIIMVSVLSNGGAVSGVSGSTLGLFTRRATNGAASPQETWWKLATGVLTSEVITVSAPAAFTTVIAFAVNGSRTASPFDGTAVTGTTDPLSITTTNANTMVLGCWRGGVPSMTAGAGFTAIQLNADFALSEYKLLSSAQTISVTIGTGAGGGAGIVDAIVQGP